MEVAGEGALLALLEKTRRRLEAEGLFASERKQALPYLPRVIGVVTSPTGAVIRDILHRLEDRFPLRVLVWPVLVQGRGAEQQIAQAIDGFCQLDETGPVPRPDLLIVARGGGSVEDLWCFNEEVVVRAIAAATIPTISAVGHETDTTLADYAADRRAPTPTAAAEMAVPVLRDLAAALDEFGLRQRKCALRPVQLGRERLEARVRRMPRPEALAAQAAQKLDELGERLRRGLADRAARARDRLQADTAALSAPLLRARLMAAQRELATTRLQPALLTRALQERRDRLASIARLAEQLHPERPLQRGYAMVLDGTGKAVTSSAAARKEAALALKFRDGTLDVAPAASSRPPRSRTAPPSVSQPKLL